MKIIEVKDIEAKMVVCIKTRVIAVDQIDHHGLDGVCGLWDENNIEYTYVSDTKAIVLGRIE